MHTLTRRCLAIVIATALLGCADDHEPTNSIETTSPPAMALEQPTPPISGHTEPLGFDSPGDLVDNFLKVAEMRDLPTYKRLIHHCPTHLKAMEEMGNIHRTLGFSTADEARQNFLDKWVGGFAKTFNRNPHQKYVEVNGDDAVVVLAASAGYGEFKCKRINGRWYLTGTGEVLPTSEYEQKYPIDRSGR